MRPRIVVLLCSLAFNCASTEDDDCALLVISPPSDTTGRPIRREVSLCVDTARTAEERMLGLLAHPPLSRGQGLYFIFPTSDELCFHSEGLSYELEVLWAATTGEVVAKERLAPGSRPVCRGPAQYALEALPDDLLTVEIGDRIDAQPD